jgi:polar amino acid transport system substrate-binding protein
MADNTPTEIILASEEWLNATNRDGTGLYWDIFRAVYEPVGIKTKFIIRSYKGSVSLVKKKKADAAVGIYPEGIQGALFSKFPFIKDYVLVLFKKNKLNSWNGQETLTDKKIGWIKGYAYDEYLEVPVVKKEYTTREYILQLLDVESVLNKGIIDPSRYTVETVLELERYLVFADNKKGKEFKKIYDHRFPHLVRSGEIEKLFAKWNW